MPAVVSTSALFGVNCRPRWRLALLLLGVCGVRPGPAQTLPPDLAAKFDAYVSQSINAMVLFTSERAISSGTYTLKGRGGDNDAKFTVPKLTIYHEFAGQNPRAAVPFVEAGLSRFSLKEEVNRFGLPADVAQFHTLTVTAGGGVKVRLAEGLRLSPGFAAGYSHVEQGYEFKNPESIALRPFIDGVLVNWDADAYSLRPSLQLDYTKTLGRVRLDAASKYIFLFTDLIHASSPAVSVASQTHLWRNQVSGLVDSGWKPAGQPLFLGLSLSRYDLSGKSPEALGLKTYYELRGDVFAKLTRRILRLEELGLTASWFFGGRLAGWRAGLYYDF